MSGFSVEANGVAARLGGFGLEIVLVRSKEIE
jgi:hypothetical protein